MAERFATLPAELDANGLELQMLERWKADGTVARVLARGADGSLPAFTFYDGPPTANGRPGIHHVLARTVKDLFCRHRAMRGYHVPRKAGWDTHGLPVEIEVEKALKISGKQDIEKYGVEEFNRRCRESVWKYREEWERLVARIAHWLDYEHPYVTYENSYIESEWWALKTMFDRDLLYRGHKILPYCPRCGTALSSHEVAQGYEDVEDPSVTVALDIVGRDRGGQAAEGRRRILVWTTTPWTLVSNAALAVHPDLMYVEARKKSGREWTVILAEARAAAVLGAGWEERWDVVARFPGRDLAGLRYRRPLDWVAYPEGKAHEVIVAEEFVSSEDGTGVVHMSPAFGADDYGAGQRHNLAMLQPVDARGHFPEGMPVIGGQFFKDADPRIIEELRTRDVLWKADTVTHSYPHCWRCGTPLLYYARTSWFVRTTAYATDMLARNAKINWVPPETGAGRFGEWLANNIDWAISRDRYWGTPLPVWVCDANDAHRTAIGSFAELATAAGRPLPDGFDPHKPFIDEWTWRCPLCAEDEHLESDYLEEVAGMPPVGTMRRVPEVIDAWFDSGSMPFAQWGYPHAPGSAERIRREFPADYIAEGVDQTRGWFYSLLAIATGLGDGLPNNAAATPSPYRNVVVHDLVRDAKGQKMSKSRGNAVDPWAVMERHGADATRLFLVSSSQMSVPKNFDEQAIRDGAGRFLITLRNLYQGSFAQYANFGWSPSARDPQAADRPALDRWVLSRLAAVEAECDAMLMRFDATSAARLIMQFVDEDVSKWYVRLARKRFYDVASDDNRAAFATLHEVLSTTCRLLAPLAPFMSDWMFGALNRGACVHEVPYVRGDGAARGDIDAPLEAAMAEIRELSRLGRAAREEAKVNVRQPLARMVCVAGALDDAARACLTGLVPLLQAEMNVKSVEFATTAGALVTLEARPNFRSLGKVFGKDTPKAAAAVTALGSDALEAFERGDAVLVNVDGREHRLTADDLTIVRRASGALVVQQDGRRFAAIDPTVTPSLRSEGIARELVSRTQRLRKETGLDVSDRIILRVAGPAPVAGAVTEHRQWIAGEVLARDIVLGDAMPDGAQAVEVALDGFTAHLALTKDT
ncbi:MAG TPA: isoleucine--tRNA ligase [Gemmatimonadaceae bacterium]|nr:isoleucine--tRNA ligase [Gemmatimonadaceae bacterium]